MLTKRLRKQIEWHFYNYKADLALYNDRVRDILESGLTANFDRVGSFGGGTPSSPTERKALQLEALDREYGWATVVRNTFNAFRFEPEYEIMVALYIEHRSRREIFSGGLWETSFYRWRDNWLEHAYKWAKELKLL